VAVILWLALGAVVLLVLLSSFIWLSFGFVGLALHLFMAGLIGALANAIVPGRLPWGWVGAILAGLVGSWLGERLIGYVGPELFGVPLIPAFVGALILALVVSAFTRLTADRTRRAY
jgi:uncharacterized membrane protein YeaQ/YmgE (transglycosylase-associated protein family)